MLAVVMLIQAAPSTSGTASTAKGEKRHAKLGGGIRASADGGAPTLSPEQASIGLAAALQTLTSDDDRDELRRVLDKASAFDAQGSFDTALAVDDPIRRRDALRRVLGYWVRQDREAAMAAVASVENLALRRDLMRSAVGSLAASTPESAFAILSETPELRNDSLWHETFSNWAKSNPDAALDAWGQISHPEERADALRGIAAAFVRKDLESAIDWTGELPTERDRAGAMADVLRYAGEANPEFAAKYFAALGGLDTRAANELAGHIAEEWAERDLTAAVEWAKDLQGSQRSNALREIANDLMRYDPDAAEAMVDEIAPGEQRRRLVSDLARLRVSAGADDVVTWIRELPQADQDSAWRGAAYEWARTRPEEAAALVGSQDLGEFARRQIIETATPQWARNDPQSAARWALTIEGEAGRGALARVFDEWGRNAPLAAIEFIQGDIDGEASGTMTRRVVGAWSQSDPMRAAEFAAGLEGGDTKSAIFRDLTERWMRNDSMAASEWVASLEPGQARDSAVTSLVQRIERDDIEAALLWADTISDEGRRDETFRRLQRRLESRG